MTEKKTEAVVIVRCPHCKVRRTIRPNEVAAADYPLCNQCGMPMVVQRASIRLVRRDRR